MKIKSLNIKNFKSIVDITINEPNPFTVFVGPNGSGKSNIFEALEYATFYYRVDEVLKDEIFGNVFNFNILKDSEKYESFDVFEALNEPVTEIDFSSFTLNTNSVIRFGKISNLTNEKGFYDFNKDPNYIQFLINHSRVFVNNLKSEKISSNSNLKLSTSAKNLEKVLKRLLEDAGKREEITDWLSLFIPEFDRIEVQKSQFSSNEDLLIYQKYYSEPFSKDLISDGTYNIVALLTAVYQSEEPQFLCIEEPENGLHPFVIRKLVDFFRQACQDKGHYIWLNTHSQTLVECLNADEVIVVDKVEGETRINQLKGTNLHGLDMAEYWLSGATGGGTPW